MNYVATKQYHGWNTSHKSEALRSVDWIFIVGVPAWRWLGEYETSDTIFYDFLFKQEVLAAPVTSIFSSLSHSSKTTVLERQCDKYIKYKFYSIIIIYIDNNAVINLNYGRLQDLFCPAKFPWVREMISSKFIDNLEGWGGGGGGGQALSKRLASPGVGYRLQPTNQDPDQNIKGAHKTLYTAWYPVICGYIPN